VLNLEEIHTADGLSCELCNLCRPSKGRDVVTRIQAVADLERRAAKGESWQLCQCCQMALSLWDSGVIDDLPSA